MARFLHADQVHLICEAAPAKDDIVAILIQPHNLLHLNLLAQLAALLQRLDENVVLWLASVPLYREPALWLQQSGHWALWVLCQLLPALLRQPRFQERPAQVELKNQKNVCYFALILVFNIRL
jgi:hypothetical protein